MSRTKRTAEKKERERTARLKRKFLERYPENKANVTQTCRELCIGRQTYYDWLEADPTFKAAIDAAFEAVIDHVEGKLHDLIDAKEPSAVYFFLKTRAKARGYVERQEHTGEGGGPIAVQFVMPRPGPKPEKAP